MLGHWDPQGLALEFCWMSVFLYASDFPKVPLERRAALDHARKSMGMAWGASVGEKVCASAVYPAIQKPFQK